MEYSSQQHQDKFRLNQMVLVLSKTSHL